MFAPAPTTRTTLPPPRPPPPRLWAPCWAGRNRLQALYRTAGQSPTFAPFLSPPPQSVKTLLRGWSGRISLFKSRRAVYIESKGNGDHLSKVTARVLASGLTCAGGLQD